MTAVKDGSVLIGRMLLFLGICILILLFTWEVFGEELSVIEVRRNIPLADEDPIYKDFYISIGSENALKKNLVVSVNRKINVKDATGSNSFGELTIPVGQLRIISVQNRIAVAREFQLTSRENEPMLEQNGIMIGDKIDLNGAFVATKK